MRKGRDVKEWGLEQDEAVNKIKELFQSDRFWLILTSISTLFSALMHPITLWEQYSRRFRKTEMRNLFFFSAKC